MRIAICDDDKNDLSHIHSLVLEYDSTLGITLFHTAKELLEAYLTEFFDVVFLDIEMEDPNGYEAAQILMQQSERPLIIFVTNSNEYTIRGYGVAFRYLPKPISFNVLSTVLSDALALIVPQKITVECAGKRTFVSLNDIIFIEVKNHHITLHLKDSTLQYRGRIKDLEELLPSGRFAKPHNSYFVNLNEVKSMTRKSLVLTNDISVPISQRNYRAFDVALTQFIRRT